MMKVLFKSPWGADDPTKATFPFLHANAFAQEGHQVQIFLLGEAVSLMRDEIAGEILPIGWQPLRDVLPTTIDLGIKIHV